MVWIHRKCNPRLEQSSCMYDLTYEPLPAQLTVLSAKSLWFGYIGNVTPDWKNKKHWTITVRDSIVSWNLRDPIQGPLETPRTITGVLY